jgi:hypothetical protein
MRFNNYILTPAGFLKLIMPVREIQVNIIFKFTNVLKLIIY